MRGWAHNAQDTFMDELNRKRPALDDVDRHLLDLLRRDARRPTSELARAVGLSPAPVSRRLERLERSGVIRGYVAVIDDQAAGDLYAFTEIRLTGETETGDLESALREMS